jgi:Transglycosylase SLT domain/SPOR domain
VCTLSGSRFRTVALLCASLAAGSPRAFAGEGSQTDPGAGPPEQPAESTQPAPREKPTPVSICQVLAAAATANELPVAFFTRLIWQESRFNPNAVSRAGALGVAQFMPGTARMRGLDDPFDPFAAIAKSAELLRDLKGQFGNLGLAAAAYNAGPGRVRDWLVGRRGLPGETRAYVRIITGRSAEEWVTGKRGETELPDADNVSCEQVISGEFPPRPAPAKAQAVAVKPWGVELVGGPTEARALAAYRDLQRKYATILADREPHLVIRGVIGDMGAARVRVGTDTRDEANKLCAELRAARWYCDVLRN